MSPKCPLHQCLDDNRKSGRHVAVHTSVHILQTNTVQITWFLSFIYIYILNSPAFGTERLSIYLRLLRSFVLDIWQMVRCSRSCGFFDMAIRTMSDAILLWIFVTVGDNAHTCHDFCVCFVLIILVNVEGYAVYCSILASRKSKLYTYIYANVWQICGIKLMWAKDYLLLCFFFSLFMRRGNKVFPRLANWNNNVVVLMFDVWTVLETTPFFIEINTGCRQIWLGASVVVL